MVIVLLTICHPDIDLILLTDPRSRSESSSTFNHIEIEKYKKYVNPNVTVVQRINECDERKNTKNINKFYLDADESADHVVFCKLLAKKHLYKYWNGQKQNICSDFSRCK